jgi:hypothetical protein
MRPDGSSHTEISDDLDWLVFGTAEVIEGNDEMNRGTAAVRGQRRTLDHHAEVSVLESHSSRGLA